MLKIKNLKKYYGDKKILDNICVEIPENSIVSVRGKNGIGKTTLLYILAGLINYQGEIEIENNINQKINYYKYMENVSLVANENFLYEYLTLEETIGLVESFSIKQDQINHMYEELVEILDLANYKNTIIKKLSLGTRQKVQIILSMITKPKILLFDESFVNLDKETVDKLLVYLTSYCYREKGIVLFSTHSKDDRLQKITTHQLEIIEGGKITFNKKEY